MSEKKTLTTWLWSLLDKTDKAHTKNFTRAGGFSGTAIKPMYSIQKMTEIFGPCGTGWGYTKPEYEVSTLEGGQVLVYCTVGLWYMKDGVKSDLVYGAGGDFVVGKNKHGLNPDDEAYKKCLTDALMNAMKHIGMAADVHMGQFDGNKYIKPEPAKLAQQPDVQDDIYDNLLQHLEVCSDLDELTKWATNHKAALDGLSEKLKTELRNKYRTLEIYFKEKR